MQVLNVNESRRKFSQILSSNETIEVLHPKGSSIILPKEQWQKLNEKILLLENEIINREMDEALSSPHKWYSTQEVEAMIGELRRNRKDWKDVPT